MNEQIVSYCEVCDRLVQFGTLEERRIFEESHHHWGVSN